MRVENDVYFQSCAEEIVSRIVHDLTDRGGLRKAWIEIDADIQAEIIQEWVQIVLDELIPEPLPPGAN